MAPAGYAMTDRAGPSACCRATWWSGPAAGRALAGLIRQFRGGLAGGLAEAAGWQRGPAEGLENGAEAGEPAGQSGGAAPRQGGGGGGGSGGVGPVRLVP